MDAESDWMELFQAAAGKEIAIAGMYDGWYMFL
jgi:hypothetical protein